MERWLLQKRVVVVSPAGPEGPRRLVSAGAARVLVVGGTCPVEPGLEVWSGPQTPERLPLRDASVDAVACVENFAELAPEARRSLLAEARRVLRDGGMLAVCTPSDGAALWQAEGELRELFAHVVSFAELAWQGVSLAPVLAASPDEPLAPALHEGLLSAPLPTRRYLVLASSGPLAEPQRECVIIPTGPATPADPAVEIAAAISAPEEIAAPAPAPIPAIPMPPIAPLPAMSAPPDLDDLFGDAPTLAPTIGSAVVAPTAPVFAAPDPALLAELETLREQAAEAEKLREQLADVETLRARAAEAERLREQLAEAEKLRGQAAEAEQLREHVAEIDRLAEQLHTQIAEVARLREQAAEAERLRAQVAELAPLQEQVAELATLRERTAELERLRDGSAAVAPAQLPEPSAELEQLREQVASLREQVVEVERLREDAVESVYLREQLAQLEPLRSRAEELERLQAQLAGFAEERDKLLAHAARLAAEIERAREEKARTEAELYSARLAIEALQRVPEDSRMHSLAALSRQHPELAHVGSTVATHELVDEVAPLVAPETGRATTDAALDRNRLREELARRTGELQTLETQVLQQEEELRRERLENVRLVTDVDRLREQVERSRAIELERVQELERLGHELRALEVSHAELQGLYSTQEQRLRDRSEPALEDGALLDLGDEDGDARERLDKVSAERDQLRAREKASAELARRRDRELAEATRTVRELRRSVDEHASTAAELRGELAVMQVHVQRLEETVPVLQERLREQQRKTLDREVESSELQRRLEESVAEQEHLRGRLRKLRQDLDALGSAKQGAEVELFRLRRELEAKHEAIEQLQQIVALGTSRFGQAGSGELSDAARGEVLRLRAAMAEQAAEHAEALARSEAEHQRVVEGERARLRRVRLEAAIRAEEMEYLLFQLDTAEQRIWEMNDAEGRAAARLAAGLAQLEKQREQYEDLADELEVTRNLLVEAQAKVAELERLLDNERARLARVSLPPDVQPDSPTGSFELSVDEPDAEGLVAPQIHRDPDEPDRLAGINFDDDDDIEPESLAVRLAASPVPEPTEADLAALGSAEISGPRFQLPSDDVDIDDEDEEEPLPTRVVLVPDEDEDDDEVFTIDTDWDDDEVEEVSVVTARPAPPPPRPQEPPASGERELSNARIVIEVLEDEAWPDDDSGSQGSG